MRKLWVFVLSLGILLSGCTQRFQYVGDTMREGVLGGEDASVTQQHVDSLPYASIYARINDGPRLFMALAFADKETKSDSMLLKWVSSDRGMIVTRDGRIVKTVGLPDTNLVHISSSDVAPFPINTSQAQQWQAIYDWQPNYRFGHIAELNSYVLGEESIETIRGRLSAKKIVEKVEFKGLNKRFDNIYWLDRQGYVVKTVQWLHPDELKIELEILKPYGMRSRQENPR